MGITDENVARQALAATGGDIQLAIDLIFGDGFNMWNEQSYIYLYVFIWMCWFNKTINTIFWLFFFWSMFVIFKTIELYFILNNHRHYLIFLIITHTSIENPLSCLAKESLILGHDVFSFLPLFFFISPTQRYQMPIFLFCSSEWFHYIVYNLLARLNRHKNDVAITLYSASYTSHIDR